MTIPRLILLISAIWAIGTSLAHSEEDDTIGLDKLIGAVVADITRAANVKAEGSEKDGGRPIFDLGETTLELQFTLQKTASGKVEASFFSFGSAEAEAAASNQNVQSVQIKLLPSTRSASPGANGGPVQFSHFDPKKPSVLVPATVFQQVQALNSSVGSTVPTGVNAKALGVANEGVVVNEDDYKRWLDAAKTKVPAIDKDLFLNDTTRVTVPNSSFESFPQE
jgi:hypothetical protein